jgi:hypothetical protein
MDLIDRYLAAVGVLLPRDQRADITAELRDALETRAEEKQGELGRPLTADEESELLQGFGHPLAVAGRYGRRQYLIGPELYPLYVFALKVLIAIIAASSLVVGGVAEALHPGDWGAAVRATLGAFWHGAAATIASVTIGAAVLERYNIRLGFLSRWRPSDLPKSPGLALHRPQTRLEHLAGILVQTLFILWWIHLLPVDLPYLTSIPLSAGQHLDLAPGPVWSTLFWPVLGLALAAVTLHVLMLTGQGRRPYVQALSLMEHLAALVIALVALRAGHWVDVSGSGLPSGAFAKIDLGVNLGFEIGLVVLAVVAACLAARDAWSLHQDRRRLA